MCTYPMSAVSKDGKEVITFTLGDGPCKLEDNLFFLTSRPGSPILRYDSVLRGCDVDDVFEGDIFEHEGRNFTMRYLRGFAGVNSDKEVVFLEDVKEYKKVSSFYQNPDLYIPRLSRYTYKTGDIMFTLEDIIGEDNGNLILNANGGMMTPVSKVQQYAGITYEKKTMYFGDLIQDHPLVLKNGRCSVNINNTFVDVTRGEL